MKLNELLQKKREQQQMMQNKQQQKQANPVTKQPVRRVSGRGR